MNGWGARKKVLRLVIQGKDENDSLRGQPERRRWSSGNLQHILGYACLTPCRKTSGQTYRSYRNGRWHSSRLNRNRRGGCS